jgi:hypothetical protein
MTMKKDQPPLLARKLNRQTHLLSSRPRILSQHLHLKRVSQTNFISTKRRANHQLERSSSKKDSPIWKTLTSDLYWGLL